MLFPYLPLERRQTVGPWELIPRQQLTETDCSAPELVGYAGDVAALYRLRGDDRGFGAFARRTDGRVGDEDDHAGFGALGSAVAVALLDRNPSFAAGAADDPNAGHAMCTSENALGYGHRFEADLYVAYATGTMVVMQHGGAQLGTHRDLIDPPNDMLLPVFRPRLDGVYADALYGLLENPAPDAPDLAGAIQWLLLAWSNTASLNERGRILALRAGFDVLFGGAYTHVIRAALSTLLDEQAAARTHRTWTDRQNQREADLTELEWWFQSFALLRNKIAHGGEIPDAEFVFDDDVRHVWHGEWNLRRAIKRTVANAGHPDVLLDEFDRVLRHHAALLIEDVEAEEAQE
jgi:hypothetical protein